MAPPAIRIRIGASVDASVGASFASIERRAKKAHGTIEREQRKSGRTGARDARRMKQQWAQGFEQIGRAAEKGYRRAERAADRAWKNQVKGWRSIGRAAERESMRAARAAERAAQQQIRAQRRAGESFARRTSHRATRFLTPNAPLASIGRRAAADVARGVGVRADLATNFANITEQENIAVKLSNKAFREGETGAAGQRVAPRTLVKEARGVAHDVGGVTGDVLGGRGPRTDHAASTAAS